MTSGTKICVIIPALGSGPWLTEALTTLRHAAKAPIDVLIVDQETPPLSGLARFAPDMTVTTLRPEADARLGFAAANNMALSEGRTRPYRYIVFLNQDTRSSPGWIDTVVTYMEANPAVAAASPILTRFDSEALDPGLASCLPQRGVPGGPISVDAIPATAMLIRAQTLRDVGPFDPIFGSYYEDFDLCRRIRASGSQVVVIPGAHVGHAGCSVSATEQTRRRRDHLIARNQVILQLRENAHPVRTLVAHLLIRAPHRLLRGLLRTPSSQAPALTLRATADLIRLAPRLLNRSRDEREWEADMRAIRL